MNWSLWRWLAWLVLLWLAATTPARAEWRRVESPNFILYGTDSEAQLRQRILLLEDFDRLLRTVTTVTDPPKPGKLLVYIVPRHADLETIRPTPDSRVGFYLASPDGTAAFIDGSKRDENEILLHEYTHHFMWQYRPTGYPTWYSEGFAEYFATVRFRPDYIDIGDFSRGRINSIQSGWLPMERVLNGGSNGLNPEAGAAFYAQSWLAVHWFFSTPERQAALRRYLAISRVDRGNALERATGMTPARFDSELRDYVRGGFVRIRRMERASAQTPPPVTSTTLPASADALILYQAALRVGLAAENRQLYLERIRAAAARHPGDPFAGRVLAHAETLHGDPAAADRLLDELLAAAPGDAELLYLKGMRHLVASERENAPDSELAAARQWLLRAHQADRTHVPTLYRLSQSWRGGALPDEIGDSLIEAQRLAPQVATITLSAAALLIQRGEHREAARLLAPLAADPHDSSLAQAARRMLQQALTGMAIGTAPVPGAESEEAETGGEEKPGTGE